MADICQLGLIGFPLGHSFSKNYFSSKFKREGIQGWEYELYPLTHIEQLPELLKSTKGLRGLNVTIPYKEAVIPYCTRLDPRAARIGAVNTLVLEEDGSITGYNTDYLGFQDSLKRWMGRSLDANVQALILGTGGAAKAVQVALEDSEIPFQYVSRKAQEDIINYRMLHDRPDILGRHHLIINTTPLGMSPRIESFPDVPYSQLTSNHWLYDLVYNPSTTRFMTNGKARGANTKNGLEMLQLQAERAWEIWTR